MEPLPTTFFFQSLPPGVQVVVYDASGYQAGCVETVNLADGLADRHLLLYDASVDNTVGVHSDLVRRHYGEVVIRCDTPERVEAWRAHVQQAKLVRVRVALEADERVAFQERFRRCKEAQEAGTGIDIRTFLGQPVEVLEHVRRLNGDLADADRRRRDTLGLRPSLTEV